jgi:hypothetical protein
MDDFLEFNVRQKPAVLTAVFARHGFSVSSFAVL